MTADGTKSCPAPAAANIHEPYTRQSSGLRLSTEINPFVEIRTLSARSAMAPGRLTPSQGVQCSSWERSRRWWPPVPVAAAHGAHGTQSHHSPAAAPAFTRAGSPISAAWGHLGQHPGCETAGPGHGCSMDLTEYAEVPTRRCHCDSCCKAGLKHKAWPLGASLDFHCWSFPKTCTHPDLHPTNPATHHEHKDSSLALLGTRQSQGTWRQNQQLLQK